MSKNTFFRLGSSLMGGGNSTVEFHFMKKPAEFVILGLS